MKKRKKGEKWKIRTVSVHLTTLERKGLLSGALYVLLVATPNCDAAINVPPDYVYIIPHFSTFVNRFFKSFSGFFEKLFWLYLTLTAFSPIMHTKCTKCHFICAISVYIKNISDFGFLCTFSFLIIFSQKYFHQKIHLLKITKKNAPLHVRHPVSIYFSESTFIL